MHTPLISIIIPYYNCEDYIEETIDSIKKQTYQNFEIILVNDGSSKDSTKFLENFLKTQTNIHYIYQENKGVASARNNGGYQAKGEYVLFLDADDCLHKNYLEKTLNILEQNHQYQLVYSKAELFEAQTGEWKLPPYQGIKSLLQGNMIYITALHRRSDFLALGGFDENLHTYEDWDYWIRLLKDNHSIYFINETLFFYRKRKSENSLTNELIKNNEKNRNDYQKIYLKNSDIFLRHQLGYYDFCDIIKQYKNTSKNDNFFELSEEIRLLKKQEKINNLLIIQLLNPIIKLEYGLHSLNRYRKAFFSFAKKKDSFLYAISELYKIYQQHGFYKAKNFLRTQHHSFDFYGIDKSEFKEFDNSYQNQDSNYADFDLSNGIIILTTRFTYYVAVLIKNSLEDLNIKCDIIFEQPSFGYQNKWHIVICPQVFPQLPRNYIAFQMEQSVSSRWFNQEYFNRLNQAKFIFDYSKVNIEFLKQNTIPNNKIYYMPIGAIKIPIDNKVQNNDNFDYEVAFYGDPNCDRRQRFLIELKKHFSIQIICDVFGDELYQLLRKSKIIVNIHYYENALLETTRLYECLSLNKVIVSEVGSDQKYHEELNDIIEFVQIDDISSMIEKIKLLLNNNNYFQEKIDKIHQINVKQSKFNQHFYQFLLDENILTQETFNKLMTEQ